MNNFLYLIAGATLVYACYRVGWHTAMLTRDLDDALNMIELLAGEQRDCGEPDCPVCAPQRELMEWPEAIEDAGGER